MTPVSTQASSTNPGDPTFRAMSAGTMKIPEPIMMPATSIVASVRVMALTNSDCGCDGSVSVGAVRLAITLQGYGRSRASWCFALLDSYSPGSLAVGGHDNAGSRNAG